MRKWVVLFIALMLMVPASVVLAEGKPNDEHQQQLVTTSATTKPVVKFTTEELFQQVMDYQPNELVINFQKGVTKEQKLAFFTSNQLTEKSSITNADISLVEVSPQTEDLKTLAIKLAKSELVQLIEPNPVVHQTFIPSDKSYNKQWYLNQISAPKAWDTTRGSASITVAVIDDGVQMNHPDLAGKIVKPYNAVTGGTKYQANDHATHIAGIIAASMNGKGVAGIAPNVKIMPINVFTGTRADGYDVIDGIYYAVANGADVINLSLGGFVYSYAMAEAVSYAFTKGTVVVAAAGNSDTSYSTYPAAYDGAFGVSATDVFDRITQFSNFGNYIDFAAPGEQIYSTVAGSSYDYMSGTSMASPVVAGVVALILSKNPLLTPNEVKTILANSARDIGNGGWDYFYGYGRVDAYRALQLTPFPMTAIQASQATFTMKGDNRQAFSFTAPGGTMLSVYIKNQGGTIVKRLVNQAWSGGKLTTLWDGKMDNGSYAKTGTYKIVATAASGNGSSFTKTLEFKVVDKIGPLIKYTSTNLYFSPILKEQVMIPFELNRKAKVTAIVYDKSGNKVRTILDGKTVNPGKQSIAWSGKNTAGTRVKDGTYQIVMTSVADNKLAGAKRTATIVVDSIKPLTAITLSDTTFKMDGANTVKGQIKLTEKTTANAFIVDSSGSKVRKIATNATYQAGTANLNWDGRNDAKTLVSEGQYYYLLELTDLAGNKGSFKSNALTIQDWQAPRIYAEEQLEFDEAGEMSVEFSVNKPGTVSVEITQNNQLIKELDRNVAVGLEGGSFNWDGKDASGNTLADGTYQFKMTFVDRYGQSTIFTGDIHQVLTEVKIHFPDVIAMDVGDYKAEAYFKLSQAANVTIEIFDDYSGQKVKTIMTDQNLKRGIQYFSWDGTDDSGYREDGDEYLYEIRAVNDLGKVTTVQGKISNDILPSWLQSHEYTLIPNENGDTFKSMDLSIVLNKAGAMVTLYVYDSPTSTEPLKVENHLLKVGENVITYVKPSSRKVYCDIVYEDELGNIYAYSIEGF